MSDKVSLAEAIAKAARWMQVDESLPAWRFVQLVELIRREEDDGAVIARLFPHGVHSQSLVGEDFQIIASRKPWQNDTTRKFVKRVA